MKNLLRIIIGCLAVAGTLGGIHSCVEEPDCSMTTRGWLQCNIYTLDEDRQAVGDTLDRLTITAYATDSVILNNQEKVTTLMLPLRYTVDSTVLVFRYSPATTDTVTIHHTNTPYFLSMECGYQMQQAISEVCITRHRLDSIYVSYNEAGIDGRENIKLFY